MWALRGSSCRRRRLSSSLCRGKQLQSRSLHDEPPHEELNSTPWVRTVQSGIDLLRNPKYNKGMSFTKIERDRNHLHGLLPPAYMNQDLQVQRVMSNVRDTESNLQKYIFLMALQERNEKLFFRVLLNYLEELLPIVYTPTVGIVCQKYGLLFRRPRGLFISINDKGQVMELLKNWPERHLRVIVVTDGQRVLGLGDLGVQGMGIPVGKITLYSACGGISPHECLPVVIDAGTNNEALLRDPFYPGLRQRRVEGELYDDLVDEFMDAVKTRYGDKVLVQFEDFANKNAFRLLLQYRGTHLVFNGDIQAVGAVALAGIIASLPLTGGKVSDHIFLFRGAGETGTGIAELLATYISKEANISIQEARERIWLVDSKGLVVKSRMDTLENHKLPFVKDFPPHHDLISSVKAVRPTALLGLSGTANCFTKEVCEAMANLNTRPIIFALSHPTTPECTAEQAYTWTQGQCVFASGSHSPPVEVNGRLFHAGQGNSAFVFPGIGLGCVLAGATRIRDEMFLAAADALASQVTDENRELGLVYPPLNRIRETSTHVAKAVATMAYKLGKLLLTTILLCLS
ncbi:hypothetical protein GOP47_0015439 [Adiantum capillus-veneris]|uniref:Malic enzyme n=1 Tax=Adiantum capillus-veneris TaxID=13818 RepID=A0A9D4UKU8_ADICA|nr:hypothetical protein GOP47_0015439 [Adiantum capillus-veneris]